MGKRGPTPVPTAILSARGSWRADRPEEPQPTPGIPICPEWIAKSDPLAATIWRDVLPLLVDQQTVAMIDFMALATLCISYSVWVRSTELAECATEGSNERKSLRKEANDAASIVLRLSQRFGLTPADRAGIHVEDAKTPDNAKSRFFAGVN